jgi:N-acetylglucosaminyl-diphospho-decaprenol L-rhamnosyltransferase
VSACGEHADLGVVILSYGHDEEFAPLVEDLLSHHQLRPDQITVAHNPYGPDDEWTPTVPEGVHLLALDDNRGYAGGLNVALRSPSAATWRLLLTHDARLAAGAVDAMLRAGDHDPRIGIVGPRLTLEDGTTWSTGVRIASGVARHVGGQTAGAPVVQRDAVDGTIMLVRAEMVQAIGGFEERFFMYWEETEFCLRARRAGWRVVVAEGAVAVTRPGSSRRHAVHAYLLTRNGLAFGWADARFRGVAGQLVEAGLRCFNSLPHPIRAHWRERPLWRIAADRVAGTGLGLLDFLRRRWGKPPDRLRRRSDIA